MSTEASREARFVLVGHPVGHSLSPAIHGAAYAVLGLANHHYTAVDCPDRAAVERVFAALRRGELRGANVTVPWKRLALELADDVDPSAAETGAANVLVAHADPSGYRLVAHNTDVPALAEELRSRQPAPRCGLVIGSGGAALAAVTACRSLGMERVGVVARKFRGPVEAWERAAEFRALGAEPVAWPEAAVPGSPFARLAESADVVVQTTSDGMHGATDGTSVRDLVPWNTLRPDVFVYDVVYNPDVTPFVAAARASGRSAESGLGMLVGQAALAIRLWIGADPPRAPLREAAERALAERAR